MLIDAGVDVNAKDSNDKSPLRLATEEKDKEMVKMLKKNGAQSEGWEKFIGKNYFDQKEETQMQRPLYVLRVGDRNVLF